MALNFPSGMMLGCGWRSEEASPMSSCGVNSRWWDDLMELVEEESDPVDLLPTDPFEMNPETTLAVAALASCLEDLTSNGGNGDLSYCLNQMFAPEPIDGYMGVFEPPFLSGGLFGGGCADQFSRLPPSVFCSEPVGFMEDPYSYSHIDLACCDTADVVPVQEGNDAHEGMMFALGYLGLRDILSVEMVCKSLHSFVRNEPFLWKCIHIDSHLGENMSDADLLRLTQKSPGSLKCLSLVGCKNITGKGLKAVLESNLQLTELGIFGSPLITQHGFLENLRSFNTEAVVGIKKLRVASLFTASKAQYEELLSFLKIDKGQAMHKQEPRILHSDCFLPDPYGGCVPDCFLPDLHDGYAIDLEKCPLCSNYKLVYDCPAEECKISRSGACRGCLVCIWRCKRCGKCIESVPEYDETFNLETVCRNCHKDEGSTATEK